MDSPHLQEQMIKKAFGLAHFIHGDRQTAIRIATDSLMKLEVAAAAQDKRLYYTPRGRRLADRAKSPAFRTRTSLGEDHLLQRLVYIESEPYEKMREQSAGASAIDDESLVIHFVKHLVRITIKRNSFYVALGLNRLLHNYSTVESMDIYNLVIQDPDRVKDDFYYRSRKARLMQEMRERFGNLLTTFKGQRGEERFNPHEQAGSFASLALECLTRFTPWNTPCPVACVSDPTTEIISALSFEGGPPDEEHRIEVNRIHALLHHECYSRLIHALKLDDPGSRLDIPKFNFSGSSSRKPPGDRRHTPELGQEEITEIMAHLDEQASRRKMAAGWLRIMVDGCERAHLDLRQSSSVQFEIDEGAEVIEARGVQGDRDTLLAVCMLPFNETVGAGGAWHSSIVLEGGQKIAFAISPLGDSGHEATRAVVAIEYSETQWVRAVTLRLRQFIFRISSTSGAKGSGRAVRLQPALAVLFILLCLALVLYIANRRSGEPEIAIVDQSAPGAEDPVVNQPPASSGDKDKSAAPGQASDKAAAPQLIARVVRRDLKFVREFDDASGLSGQHTRGGTQPHGSPPKVTRIYIQPLSDEPSSNHVRDLLLAQPQLSTWITASNSREEADAALRFIVKRKAKHAQGAQEVRSITVQLVDEDSTVIWPAGRDVQGRRYTGPIQKVVRSIAEDLSDDLRKLQKQ